MKGPALLVSMKYYEVAFVNRIIILEPGPSGIQPSTIDEDVEELAASLGISILPETPEHEPAMSVEKPRSESKCFQNNLCYINHNIKSEHTLFLHIHIILKEF